MSTKLCSFFFVQLNIIINLMRMKARRACMGAACVMAFGVCAVLKYHPDNVRYRAAIQKNKVVDKVHIAEDEEEIGAVVEDNSNKNNGGAGGGGARHPVNNPTPLMQEPPPRMRPGMIKCDGASKHRSREALALSADTVSLLFVGDVSFGKAPVCLLIGAGRGGAHETTTLLLWSVLV